MKYSALLGVLTMLVVRGAAADTAPISQPEQIVGPQVAQAVETPPARPPRGPGAGGGQAGPGAAGVAAPDRGPNADRRQPPPTQGDPDPWLQVHFAEIDDDHDGVVTRAEVNTEVQRTYDGYDTAKAGKVAVAALGPGVRTAMAGFVREHVQEVDRNQDGFVTRDEVAGALTQMFNRADGNRDGRIDLAEIAAGNPGARRGGAGAR